MEFKTEHRIHKYIHLFADIWMIVKNKFIKPMSIPASV